MLRVASRIKRQGAPPRSSNGRREARPRHRQLRGSRRSNRPTVARTLHCAQRAAILGSGRLPGARLPVGSCTSCVALAWCNSAAMGCVPSCSILYVHTYLHTYIRPSIYISISRMHTHKLATRVACYGGCCMLIIPDPWRMACGLRHATCCMMHAV